MQGALPHRESARGGSRNQALAQVVSRRSTWRCALDYRRRCCTAMQARHDHSTTIPAQHRLAYARTLCRAICTMRRLGAQDAGCISGCGAGADSLMHCFPSPQLRRAARRLHARSSTWASVAVERAPLLSDAMGLSDRMASQRRLGTTPSTAVWQRLGPQLVPDVLRKMARPWLMRNIVCSLSTSSM